MENGESTLAIKKLKADLSMTKSKFTKLQNQIKELQGTINEKYGNLESAESHNEGLNRNSKRHMFVFQALTRIGVTMMHPGGL